MIREQCAPREDWPSLLEEQGFTYHSIDGVPYWDESICYRFSAEQVTILEKASADLYALCLEAVQHVITKKRYAEFSVPEAIVPLLEESWYKDYPSVYGRFDLSWNGDVTRPPKMLEFNADTPTSLFEASIIQWYWLRNTHKKCDQFNSIHEKLVEQWRKTKFWLSGRTLWFSCLEQFPEDFVNTGYLQDCAMQAGIPTGFIAVPDIGWNGNCFTDKQENPITAIFKLYPWEWMVNEAFGQYLPAADTLWIEPPWKMLLSNKAILPVLWELFPNHPNLLETYFDDPRDMKDYVMKPLLSREGANVIIVENGSVVQETGGEYGEEGYICQALARLPDFDGNYPVIGSWIIGHQPAGMGIRESSTPITGNLSRFVPNYFR